MSFINLDRLRVGQAGCPSDLTLDRLVAEAMLPAEVQATRKHIAHCAECEARVELRRSGFDAFPALDEQRLLAAIEGELGEARNAQSALAFLCQFAQRNPFE